MDILGHAFSGALVGRCVAPRGAPRTPWTGLGVLAATMPDVDAVSYLWGPDTYASVHQVYTHNILSFLFVPPILAWMFHRRGKWDASFAQLCMVMWIGMASHLLGDVIAWWPLRPFLPWSDVGFAFRWIRSDFSIGLPIIFALGVVLGHWDPLVERRREVSAATLLAGVLYVAVTPGW